MRTSLFCRIALICFAALSPVFGAGEPVGGFPNWSERVIHQWMNRARSAPQVEMQSCGANCLEAPCYSVMPPLAWSLNLSRAARFHADHMARAGFFAHDSNCDLSNNIGTTYPAACDGSASCACEATGMTPFSARAGLFGSPASGEIIASSTNPNSAFYMWLYEPGDTTNCQFTQFNGHRWLILRSGGAVGVGVGSISNSVGDFAGGVTPTKVVSGAHYPRNGATVETWANWYDSAGPLSADAVVDGVARPMTLQRGTVLNGAWLATVTGMSTGCHRYYFSFRDSAGQTHRYPGRGTYGIGPAASCPDWIGGVKGDLDADGDGDLVWRNYATGANTIWRMNGTTYGSAAPLFDVLDPTWRLEASGDLNGDSAEDLVWRNYSTGANAVWYMSGATYTGASSILSVADSNWKIRGAGDLNSDGRADLIWRNEVTGANAVWYMNGSTQLGTASLLAVPDLNWTLGVVNDFNNDGIADLVWRNTATGRNSIWFMNGTSFSSSSELWQVADVNWKPSGAGDFNNDGAADLVWRNVSTGQNVVWFLNGAGAATGSAVLPAVTVPGWELAGPR